MSQLVSEDGVQIFFFFKFLIVFVADDTILEAWFKCHGQRCTDFIF